MFLMKRLYYRTVGFDVTHFVFFYLQVALALICFSESKKNDVFTYEFGIKSAMCQAVLIVHLKILSALFELLNILAAKLALHRVILLLALQTVSGFSFF